MSKPTKTEASTDSSVASVNFGISPYVPSATPQRLQAYIDEAFGRNAARR